MTERISEDFLSDLEAKHAAIDNDYRPTCETVNYGSGCPGANDSSIAFWRAAVDCVPAMIKEIRLSRSLPLAGVRLTEEEVEALEWLIRHVNATTMPGVRPRRDKANALAVLDRLLGQGGAR